MMKTEDGRNIILVNGIEMIEIITKTIKGRKHPTNGVYVFNVLLSKYIPKTK